VAFTKVVILYQIHHTWIHPLHQSPLSLFPHSWNSYNRSSFSIYIHMYTIFTLYSFSHTLLLHFPPSHWYQSPRQDLFCPLVFQFCKRKKVTFLFKIAIQGVSLWHLCMCYNPNWFICSIFLPSSLVPFVWWFQQV
jgi:hypothetical protein